MADFGVLIFPTEYSIAPAPLAKAAEARGFESLFFTEHTHIPVSRRTPWPGGAELPREYAHTFDPFVALSNAAAVTRTLRLGTGITLMPQIAMERDDSGIRYIPFAEPVPSRQIGLVWRKTSVRKAVIERVAALVNG